MLPLISKIFERVIHSQLQTYINTYDILYKFQSGFRTEYSTETCLANLHNKILNGFDRGEYTGMILIDLQKVFDTINHKILFQKLKHIGLSPTAIEWVKFYLTNRSTFVEIENQKSTLKDINCGVPQGSILGPLLFLIYINDMPQSVSVM